MKKRKNLLVVVLSVCILMSIVGMSLASILATDSSEQTQSVSSQETAESSNDLDGLIEETDKRQINSKTYLDPVKKLHKTIIDLKPIHYRDNNNKWQDIVLELKDSSDPQYNKEYHQGDISIKLSEKSRPQDMVSIKNKDKEITFAPIDESSIDVTLPRNVNKDLQTPNGAFGTRAANFENVYQDIDFRYELKQDSLKEIIYINKPTTKNVFKFLIKANGLDAKLNSDNSVSFTDSTTNSLFFDIQKSFATDSSNKPEVYKDLTTQIEKQGSHYILTLTLDPSWLSDPERVYPIIIDPTTKYYIQDFTTQSDGSQYGLMTGKACKVYQGAPSTNQDGPSGTNLAVGENGSGDDWRIYVQVNPTASEYTFLSGKRIVSAKQGLYMYGQSDTSSRTLYMYKVTSPWGETSITWNNQPISQADGIPTKSSGSTLEWKEWNITNTFTSWQSNPTSNHGLMVWINNDNYNQYKQFYGDEYLYGGLKSAKRPRLAVEYTDPPTATATSPSGDEWITNPRPTLTWSYSDPDGDQQSKYRVQVSKYSDFNITVRDTNELVGTNKSWTLDTDLPTNTKYYWRVKVFDSYDWSAWSSAKTFRFDNQAPTGTVKINNNDSYTNRQDVTLSSSYSDNYSGVKWMQFKNEGGNWSGWQNPSVTRSWNLPTTDGTKIVYAQYKDDAGNVSSSTAINDQIVLDPNDLGLEKSIAANGMSVPGHGGSVNLSSGNLNLSAQDLQLDSLSPGVKVERVYNSKSTQSSAFGPSWILGVPKITTSSTDLTYTDETGAKYIYQKSGTSSFIRPASQSLTIELINGKYIVTNLDKTTYEYDLSGKLIKAYDTNNNPVNYTYTNNNLTKIADDAGQEINLTYSNNLLTRIQDSAGRGVTYSYNQGYLSQIVGYDNSTTSFVYTNGKLTTVTDTLGNSYSLSYYGDGKFYGVVDPQGHLTFNEYYSDKTTTTLANMSMSESYLDKRGRLTKFVDPMMVESNYEYDLDDNQTKAIDPYGAQTSSTYDSYGRKITEADAYGYSKSSTYDSFGNLIREVDEMGATTSFTFDAKGNRLTETDAHGNTSSYTYDSRGMGVRSTNALGHTSTTSYDSKGKLAYSIDELGNKQSYEYDQYGNTVKEINEVGATVSYSYNIRGQETTITEPTGAQTSLEYDVLGRKTREITPEGLITTTSYDSLGQVASVESPTGTTIYSYDELGNKILETNLQGTHFYYYDEMGHHLISEINREGSTTSYSYDLLGRKTQVEDAQHNITSYSYDLLGRTIGETNPEGETTQSTYNAADKVLTETTPKGETTTKVYDVLGNVVNIIKPDNSRVTYSYNEVGDTISETIPGNATTTYEYDEKGQKLNEESPTDKVTSYSYDPTGNEISTTTPGGKTTFLEYEYGQQLNKTVYPDNTDTSYDYNSADKLINENSVEGTTSYSYNTNNGKLSTIQDPEQATVNKYYDASGNVTQKTTLGRTFNYTYDNLSRKTSSSDSLAGTFSSDYDSIGNLVISNRPNQTKTTFSYDGNKRAEQLLTYEGNNLTNTFKYTFDSNGNRITTVENNATNSYSYDSKKQMTASVEKVIHSVYPHTKYAWYTYDINGNRQQMKVMISTSGSPSQSASLGLSEILNRVITSSSAFNTPDVNDNVTQALEFLLTGQPMQKQLSDELIKAVRDAIVQAPFVYQYSYNIEDQLMSLNDPVAATNYSYAYDVNGNMVSKADYYGSYNYMWDELNRLAKIVRTPSGAAPSLTVSYSYDSTNRRTMAIINRKDSVTKSISTTHSYEYSESSLMEETITKTTTINGQLTTENHTIKYTPGSAITLDNTTYYYITNGHGDIKEVTDTNGDTVVKYYYDAWGNLTNVTPSASQATSLDTAKKLAELNPYTYSNYQYEGADTGIYYLKARYYDPVTGRFISKDPVKYHNLYIYSVNNPVNRIDSDGESNRRVDYLAAFDGEWASYSNGYNKNYKKSINAIFKKAFNLFRKSGYDPPGPQKWTRFGITERNLGVYRWYSDDDKTDEVQLAAEFYADMPSPLDYNADLWVGFSGQGLEDLEYAGLAMSRHILMWEQGSVYSNAEVLQHEMLHQYDLYDANKGETAADNGLDYYECLNHLWNCVMETVDGNVLDKLCNYHKGVLWENRNYY